MNHHLARPGTRTPLRRSLSGRRSALVASVTSALVLAPLVAAPAFADTPASWEKAPHVSGLQFLVVLLLIPAVLFVAIAVLASLPSIIGGNHGATANSWRGEGEWFGGPREGIDAADDVPALEGSDTRTGGASAHW